MGAEADGPHQLDQGARERERGALELAWGKNMEKMEGTWKESLISNHLGNLGNQTQSRFSNRPSHNRSSHLTWKAISSGACWDAGNTISSGAEGPVGFQAELASAP